MLLSTGVPFSGMRVGMYSKRKATRVVFDILGETINDPLTGEFAAGVITCRDVTSLAQEITHIKELDEERFKLICDTMPQMVWTTTPDGLHDFFNSRWCKQLSQLCIPFPIRSAGRYGLAGSGSCQAGPRTLNNSRMILVPVFLFTNTHTF